MAGAPHDMLFILTDQQRTDTLGCYGHPDVRTPAIDAIAAEGTTFENCFTPTAICSPARASLLTGVRPFRHRMLANYERNVGYIEELPDSPDLSPFSLRLREAGYNVGLAGKWHVGRRREPAEFGFDGTHYPGWHNPVGHPRYVRWLAQRGLRFPEVADPVRPTFPNGEPGNLLAGRLDLPADATFEAFLAEETIETLRRYAGERRTRDRPFFMATHFFGPHLPYLLPAEYLTMYDPEAQVLPASVAETFENKPPVQRRYHEHWGLDTLPEETWRWLLAAYRGYASLIDVQVRRILDALEELGLRETTCIGYSADHGEFTGAHRLTDKGPAMYEDIYRIPALLRIPGAPAGRREDRLTTLLDFTATFLDLAGLPPDPEAHGQSLVPLALGRDVPWRDAVFAEFHGHHFPYPQRMIRTPTAKLIVNPESVNELYDLEHDPDELVNLIDDPAHRTLRDALIGRLYAELRACGDNFHHWMATMLPVGGKDYDTSLSDFEGTRHQEGASGPGGSPTPGERRRT